MLYLTDCNIYQTSIYSLLFTEVLHMPEAIFFLLSMIVPYMLHSPPPPKKKKKKKDYDYNLNRLGVRGEDSNIKKRGGSLLGVKKVVLFPLGVLS